MVCSLNPFLESVGPRSTSSVVPHHGVVRRIAKEVNNYFRLERALAMLHMTGRKRTELDIGAQVRAGCKRFMHLV